MGKEISAIVAAGRLAKQGLDRLKSALDRLSELFSSEAMSGVKERIAQVWEKLHKGEYTREFLRWLLGAKEAEARVEEICRMDGLNRDTLDTGSRELAGLDDRYRAVAAVLEGLASAVLIVAATLAYFTAIAPWVPLGSALAYVAVIGGALVVAATFMDKGPGFGSVRGVSEIIESVTPVKS
jgi:hypothetical protein